MRTFLRFILPATYFQATRLNRWALVGYNGLVEWVPAVFLSLYFNDFDLAVIPIVLLSYAAFICVYEIGYITNDHYTERYEAEPRGRSSVLEGGRAWVIGLIISRIGFWLLFTYAAGAMLNRVWWAFHITLAATFALHNFLPSRKRISTFFALSTYRFFGPVILSLSAPVIVLLLPAVLLNNSLYRTTVYVRSKEENGDSSPDVKFKFGFYLGCLPLSAMFTIVQESLVPVLICTYFILVWTFYWLISRLFPSATRL